MVYRLICIVSVLALGGCAIAGGYPESPVNTNMDIEGLKRYFGTDMLAHYDSAPDLATKMAVRNEIIYGRIAAYDAEFSQFQIDISRERALTDATGDSIIAVTSAAATGFSAKGTKTALTGVATAVTGIKGAVDKDVFFDQAMASLFSYMASNRTTILAKIEKNVALPVTAYPLTAGLADTAAYRDAGSIPGALASIAEQAGPAKEKAQTTFERAQAVKFQSFGIRLQSAPAR